MTSKGCKCYCFTNNSHLKFSEVFSKCFTFEVLLILLTENTSKFWSKRQIQKKISFDMHITAKLPRLASQVVPEKSPWFFKRPRTSDFTISISLLDNFAWFWFWKNFAINCHLCHFDAHWHQLLISIAKKQLENVAFECLEWMIFLPCHKHGRKI